MKEFLTVKDIEDLASRGITQIMLTEDLVVTDMARDLATILGVTFLRPDHAPVIAAPTKSVPTSQEPGSLFRNSLTSKSLDPKPKGCLHYHLEPSGATGAQSTPTEAKPIQGGSNTASLVDRLVEAMRRLSR